MRDGSDVLREPRIRVSACIIARDEARLLPACLASVDFCDEVVLVDGGSTDATIALARAAGARVIEQPWLGFAAQRNVALDHARGEWVLEIDADERVSPRLRAEIERFLSAPPPAVDLCGLPRRNYFLGRALGPSAKYPQYCHRLLRRGAYRHDEARTVHEGLVPHGAVQPFEGDLLHLLADGWREAIGDAWRYARLEAGQMQTRSSPGAFLRGALARPAAKLVYRVAVDGGWRDGWRGLAKIALDCATDSAVWMRRLLGRRGGERGRSGVAGDQHYGSRKFRQGSPRVVGVAAGARARARAKAWLAAAAAGGADVMLIADAATATAATTAGSATQASDTTPVANPTPVTNPTPATDTAVRVRPVERLGPLTLIRALDAEEQLRPLDAVVAFGARARLMLRIAPPGLRGQVSPPGDSTSPRGVATRTALEALGGRW